MLVYSRFQSRFLLLKKHIYKIFKFPITVEKQMMENAKVLLPGVAGAAVMQAKTYYYKSFYFPYTTLELCNLWLCIGSMDRRITVVLSVVLGLLEWWSAQWIDRFYTKTEAWHNQPEIWALNTTEPGTCLWTVQVLQHSSPGSCLIFVNEPDLCFSTKPFITNTFHHPVYC